MIFILVMLLVLALTTFTLYKISQHMTAPLMSLYESVRKVRMNHFSVKIEEKYNIDIMTMTGFLDGINDSLKTPNPIEEMEEDTQVSLLFDKELLYKNMVDAKADWLYNLPAWDEIFDAETKHALYLEQKKSGTVVVGKKIGRNDPCPCGSGKKYKKCCGKNA